MLTFNDLACYYSDVASAFEVFGYNEDQTQAIDLVVKYIGDKSGDFTEADIELDFSFVATGTITVDALNANGKTVSCKLGAATDGITEVKTDAPITKKCLIDGKILIHHNGNVFNVQGVQVK